MNQLVCRELPSFSPVYQGQELGCVPCSISYVANYLKGEEAFHWKELFNRITIKGEGANIEEVLNLAKKLGWITNYRRIRPTTYQNLVKILESGPLIIGLPVEELYWAGIDRNKPLKYNGNRSYGHMCVLWDLTETGDYRVVNFAKEHEQDWRILDKSYPIERAYILSNAENKPLLERMRRFVKEML